jgi:hypothetical protein
MAGRTVQGHVGCFVRLKRFPLKVAAEHVRVLPLDVVDPVRDVSACLAPADALAR